MDRLAGMEVFARVVETGSFSEAARQLGLSKSAVSKQISALEDRLGVRLLNRTTRRLSVTEVGEGYYAWCRQITEQVHEAELSVSRLHAEPRGSLKINAPVSFGFLQLAPMIPEFLASYPDLDIDVTVNDRFVDVIDEGYDVVIRIGKLADSSLVARRLGSAELVVCGAPSYLAAHGEPTGIDDLSRFNCMVYNQAGPAVEWRFQGPDGPRTLRPKGNFRSNNGDILRHAAIGGVGLARLPMFIVWQDLRSGTLKQVLGDYRDSAPGIYALYPHNRHLSAKVRAFVDFLARRLGEHPCWAAQAPMASEQALAGNGGAVAQTP